MSVGIGGKPLLSCNTEHSDTVYACNHICMFNHPTYNSNIKRQTNHLHHNTAVYFRYKTYSVPYHEFLITKYQNENNQEGREKEKLIIPAGCLEFFCNHLHITKDKSHLPTATTILRHLLPISIPSTPPPPPPPSSSTTTTTLSLNSSTIYHNDLFIQCGIENISFDYSTSGDSSSSLPAQQLSVSLHQLAMVYYSNLNCPCCTIHHDRECLASVVIDEFTVTCGRIVSFI